MKVKKRMKIQIQFHNKKINKRKQKSRKNFPKRKNNQQKFQTE